MLQMARSGDFRARLRAVRDGQAAVRLAAVGAGLRTGVLDHLREAPSTAGELAKRAGWTNETILEGLLQVLAGLGLVHSSRAGWELAARGRAVRARAPPCSCSPLCDLAQLVIHTTMIAAAQIRRSIGAF